MAISEPRPPIELLLADARTGQPTLTEGLPADAVLNVAKPSRAAGSSDKMLLDAPGAHPDDLAEQRWGVIIPKGAEGDALLDAIAGLIALREEEQGAKAIVYRVNPDMTTATAAAWREKVYFDEEIAEADRPRYLLILGGLHQVSLELQHVLAQSCFVGRLHFDDASGYAAYADKVRRYAGGPALGRPAFATPDALFFAARDPTMTTIAGYKQLVKPCADAASSWERSGKLGAENIVEVTKWGVKLPDFLGPASGERPAVMLSSSHGLGVSRSEPIEKRHALQGALTLGTAGTLSAETLAGARFLPGGMWICVACFGGGTPSESAYAAWLSLLSKGGAPGVALEKVLETLPAPGEPPFIAALPKAALSSPDGPLGVIAHMDLAWSYSFLSTETFSEGRASRIFSAIRVLVAGGRAGVALDALMRSYRAANDDLMAGYQAQENARVFGHADPTDPWRRGHTWMLRNDLEAMCCSGIRLARITLKGAEPRAATRGSQPGSDPPRTPVAVSKSDPAPPMTIKSQLALPVTIRIDPAPSITTGDLGREAAVLALLQGDEAPRVIASRFGVTLETLWLWLEAYCAGGRQALNASARRARKIRSDPSR